MSYKTILLHLDQSSHLPQRIRSAAKLARRLEAHLVGVATSGLSRFMQTGVATDGDPAWLADQLDLLRRRAAERLARFAQLALQDGALAIETRQLDDDDIGGLCLQARYSDLLVLGQPDPAEMLSGWPADLVPNVVLHGARPVLHRRGRCWWPGMAGPRRHAQWWPRCRC